MGSLWDGDGDGEWGWGMHGGGTGQPSGLTSWPDISTATHAYLNIRVLERRCGNVPRLFGAC